MLFHGALPLYARRALRVVTRPCSARVLYAGIRGTLGGGRQWYGRPTCHPRRARATSECEGRGSRWEIPSRWLVPGSSSPRAVTRRSAGDDIGVRAGPSALAEVQEIIVVQARHL